MQKFIETTGKTEDAAIAAALEQLGLSREEVSVEVLDLRSEERRVGKEC